jgi:hypothetical protein
MKKNTSKEAFCNRLQELSDIKDFKSKSNDRNIGTLIDIERNSDGVAFGIVKENHNYYIKRGGTKQNLDASDFCYIGGLENITSYQFHTLAESEKQRNYMIAEMNQSAGIRVNASVSKMIISEDVAGEHIKNAEASLDTLEAATAAEKSSPEITANDGGNMGAGDMGDGSEAGMGDDMNTGTGDMGAGGEMGDDMGDGSEIGDEPAGAEGDEVGVDGNKAIEKAIGKLTNTIRKADMTPEESKSFLASLISSFKEKLPEIEVEDRKELANKLMKINDSGEKDLEDSMPDETEVDETAEVGEETCSECGGFTQYAESRGYTQESIMECGDDEMGSLISGYANAHKEGKNNGDAETVSLYTNPKVNESLVEEYGHEDYVNEVLKPEIMKLSEATDEDKQLKIAESWKVAKIGKKAAVSTGNTLIKEENDQKFKVYFKKDKFKTEDKGTLKKSFLTKDEADAYAKKMNAGVNHVFGNDAGYVVVAEPKKINETEDDEVENDNDNIDDLSALGDLDLGAEGDTDANVDDVDDVTAVTSGAPIETPAEDSMFATDSQSLGAVNPSPMATTEPISMGAETGVVVDVNAQSKTVNVKMNEGKKPTFIKGQKPDFGKKDDKPKDEKKGAKPTFVKGQKPDFGKKDGEKEEISEDASDVKAALAKGTAKKTTPVTSVAKTPAGGEKGNSASVVASSLAKGTAKKAGAVTSVAKTPNGGEKGNSASIVAAALAKGKVSMSESETKLRKYVKNHLLEIAGLKKATLNESAKSPKLKQLDKLIESQYADFKKLSIK